MGVAVEVRLATLVELLVEADVSCRQIKVADVVAASVVVVVGVGTWEASGQFTAGWCRDGEVGYRSLNNGSERTDYQRTASTVNGAGRGDGRAVDGARSMQWQLEDWL